MEIFCTILLLLNTIQMLDLLESIRRPTKTKTVVTSMLKITMATEVPDQQNTIWAFPTSSTSSATLYKAPNTHLVSTKTVINLEVQKKWILTMEKKSPTSVCARKVATVSPTATTLGLTREAGKLSELWVRTQTFYNPTSEAHQRPLSCCPYCNRGWRKFRIYFFFIFIFYKTIRLRKTVGSLTCHHFCRCIHSCSDWFE